MYTSIPLADWLLDRSITITGTIQTTRKVIPKELRETSKRNINSYEVLWNDSGKLVLNSYVVNTNSTGKKNVMILTTVKPILGTSKHDPKLKPAIYKQYDYTGCSKIYDPILKLINNKPEKIQQKLLYFLTNLKMPF